MPATFRFLNFFHFSHFFPSNLFIFEPKVEKVYMGVVVFSFISACYYFLSMFFFKKYFIQLCSCKICRHMTFVRSFSFKRDWNFAKPEKNLWLFFRPLLCKCSQPMPKILLKTDSALTLLPLLTHHIECWFDFDSC